MSHISVSDAINVGVIGYESKNAVPSSVNTPLTKANEFNEIIIKVQFLLMQPCAGYLDHPFTKSVVVGRTISLCNPTSWSVFSTEKTIKGTDSRPLQASMKEPHC